jgi:CheY-like chemotaxis protein
MGNTILIIDHQKEIVDALTALFLQHGWVTQRAFSGADGLAAARRHLPSVVISDLAMPGVSGFDVAESLRCTYSVDCPVLIALTGWTDSGVAQQALAAGYSIVLTKPVDFNHLFSVVNLGIRTRSNPGQTLSFKK